MFCNPINYGILCYKLYLCPNPLGKVQKYLICWLWKAPWWYANGRRQNKFQTHLATSNKDNDVILATTPCRIREWNNITSKHPSKFFSTTTKYGAAEWNGGGVRGGATCEYILYIKQEELHRKGCLFNIVCWGNGSCVSLFFPTP